MSKKMQTKQHCLIEFMQAVQSYIRPGHIRTNDIAFLAKLKNWAKMVHTQVFEYLPRNLMNIQLISYLQGVHYL